MRQLSNGGKGVKSMKCLRCDVLFKTTPERRLCSQCVRRAENMGSNDYNERPYDNYDDFAGSIWYGQKGKVNEK